MVKIWNMFYLTGLITLSAPLGLIGEREIPYVESYHHITEKKLPSRDITFFHDLVDMVELDLMCQHLQPNREQQKCLSYFGQNVVIKIISDGKEYVLKSGEKMHIPAHNKWTLRLEKISNEALLSLKTFRDIVLDHFMPKKQIANFMDEWILKPYNQAKIFVYQKFLAPVFRIFFKKEATTSISITIDIAPHYESISCSDIILDLDKLHEEGQLSITVEHEDLWNLHVKITSKRASSLPNNPS